MQHLSNEELARRAIRSQICSICCDRPKGSDSFGPEVARVCESTCAIFASLPTLQALVADHDPQLDSIESAMRNNVCNKCKISPSAGDTVVIRWREHARSVATRWTPLSCSSDCDSQRDD